MLPSRSAGSEAELLRSLVEHIPAMVAYWDASLHCRFANRAYEQWFGVSPEALIGKHIRELLGPLYEKNLPHIEAALRGERQEFEREIPDPSGGPSRHGLASYIPHVVDGAVHGFFALVTDVSEIKRAQLALRESEERFRLTVDEAPIGMALVARDGRFVRVNRALCDIVGYTADELTGLSFQDITHPADLDADLALVERLARGEIPRYQLAKRYLRKDGTIVDVMLSASAVRDRDGAPRYFIAQVEDVTEQKRLEDELRLAEATASGIVATSADAIISTDEHQSITMFNNAAEQIFGWSAAEVLGAPLYTLIPERFRVTHRRHVAAFDAGAELARGMAERRAKTIVGLRKNGAEFPADASISKLEVGGKKLFTVALRDVTEQKRAQEAVRLSQERFELALEGGDLASWDWNVETGEVVFNRRWAEMRGLRPEDVRPHVDSWMSGLHPDDRQHVQKALNDHFEGRSPVYDCEHRVRTRSGQWIWILDRGKVFARNAAGRPTRMVGTELDITERKRAQDEQAFLAEVGRVLAGTLETDQTLQEIGRLAVRGLADCVIVDLLDESAQLRRVLVVHGDSSKDALCAKLKDVRLDPRRPHLASAMLATGKPALLSKVGPHYVESVAQNEEHLRALRELDPRSIMTVPLEGREGARGALVFVCSHPTRRFGLADLHLATELAHRASLALENARLYEAARLATRMRDDVLGIVAHDLRNPLGTILMQAAILRRRTEESESKPSRRSGVDIIERAATRMNRLIDDLLDVTRMEAGRLTVEHDAIPAESVASDAVEAQEQHASAASLDLRRDLARDLPAVWGDRDRLLQIFENLIGNAMKFTEAGGRITVGAAPREGEVLFWVADTGVGLAPEDVPRVFDRFWQAQASGQRGAGLGLPVVKGLVDAHGGRIWVESSPGQGSTFFFTIPAAPRAEARPRATAHHASSR